MVRGTAARYLRLLLCTAGIATAQSYVAASSYGKDAAATIIAGGAPALCRAAVRTAEYRRDIPRGLLLAIAEVETGRRIADGRPPEPWPWSANAENQSLFFATRQDAVAWTKQALRRGVASIDSGCMQVNLQQHPDAFASVDEAFDPMRNADYAARYLMQLYRQTGSWGAAVGWYHSHTPALADPYRDRVQAAFVQAVMHRREEILVQMAEAWAATRPGAAPPALTPRWPDSPAPTVGRCQPGGAPYSAYGNAALRLDRSCPP